VARETGFDLTDPDTDRLGAALAGVGAVVEVTSFPAVDETAATDFFTTVATQLGRAATAAGVPRSVVLSIVGLDESQDFPYYRAKLAHEEATRKAASGALVLRATQFHDFARQSLEWNTDSGVARIMDVPTQPVDTAEIARVLLDMATGEIDRDVDLAGPKPERLVDLVRRYAEHVGSDVVVEPDAAVASISGGSMLPQGDDTLIRGIDWQTWLERQPR
jgi:uncharacterized protein YbjT (DUF2867 family)